MNTTTGCGCNACQSYTGGYGFLIILVLFILLAIIGALVF